MKKKIFVGILVIMICFTLCGCNKEKDFVKYESDLIIFDFADYVTASKGESQEDYANVVFELDESKIDEFQTEIGKYFHLLEEKEITPMKKTELYKTITDFCAEEDILKMYQTFRSGKKAKTRDIYATTCYKDDAYYFNIIG